MNKLGIVFITLIFISKVGAQSSTFAIADSLYQVGNYSKAIQSYKKLENNSYTSTQIAKAYKALGNSKKAIENYEKVLRVDSLNTLVLYDYGKLLFSAGKLEKSLVIFEQLQLKDTLNPNFHYQIGLAKEGLQQEDFIDSYEKAFQLDPQHQKSSYKIIKNYIETKDFDKAKEIIKIGLQNNEDDAKIIGFNAQLFYALKEYRKALLWFEKLIDRKKATTLLGYKDIRDIRKFLKAEPIDYKKPLTPLPHFDIKNSSGKDLDNWKKDVILWYETNKANLPSNIVDKEKMIDMVYKQFMAYRTKPLTIEERFSKLEEQSQEYNVRYEKMNKELKNLKLQIKKLKRLK